MKNTATLSHFPATLKQPLGLRLLELKQPIGRFWLIFAKNQVQKLVSRKSAYRQVALKQPQQPFAKILKPGFFYDVN